MMATNRESGRTGQKMGRKTDQKNDRKMGLIFFPAFDWAITPTHPEREERLLYTKDQIFEEGLMDLPQVEEYKPRLAELKDIARVHFCLPSVESLVTEAHLIAAGSTLVLADAFMKKEITSAFALVRPPGHHSMRVAHGNRGFCNINNEAIMVEYIRRKYGIRRVAIVDTDVHHGDGTQDIFYHDPDVLFISFHQDGRTLYPGSGFMDELGGPKAMARTINIPLPPETPDEGIHYVLEELVLPILDDFKPQLIVNSAGQDNHYTDPLANMRFSAQGYAKLNEMLSPDIAVLEGGYAIESALPYVNTGIILAMAGLDYSNVIEPDYYPGKFSMGSKMKMNIEAIVQNQMNNWDAREELTAKAVERAGPFYRKRKNVFYDTDGIREKQIESVRMCPDKNCPGYMTIDTNAVRGYGSVETGFGVFVPLFACKQCQREAREEYASRKNDSAYNYIYLQDGPANDFRLYSTRMHNEQVY